MPYLARDPNRPASRRRRLLLGRTQKRASKVRTCILLVVCTLATAMALAASPDRAQAYAPGAHYALVMNVAKTLPADNVFKQAIDAYPDYAAWGSDGPDIPAALPGMAIGRVPWFDSTHNQAVGQYCRFLLQKSVADWKAGSVYGQREMAFAAGYATHVSGDLAIHGILVNPECGTFLACLESEIDLHHRLEGWADIYTWVELAGLKAEDLTPKGAPGDPTTKLYRHFVANSGFGTLTIQDDGNSIENLVDAANKAVILQNGAQNYGYMTNPDGMAIQMGIGSLSQAGDYYGPANMRRAEGIFAETLASPDSRWWDPMSWLVAHIRDSASMYHTLPEAEANLAYTGNVANTSTPIGCTRERRVAYAWVQANDLSRRLLTEASAGTYGGPWITSDAWVADSGLNDGRQLGNLRVDIQTGWMHGAGTDLDVWFGADFNDGENREWKLDWSGYNDFENGDFDTYYIPYDTWFRNPIWNVKRFYVRLASSPFAARPFGDWDLWQIHVFANNRTIFTSAWWDHWYDQASMGNRDVRTVEWPAVGGKPGLGFFNPAEMPSAPAAAWMMPPGPLAGTTNAGGVYTKTYSADCGSGLNSDRTGMPPSLAPQAFYTYVVPGQFIQGCINVWKQFATPINSLAFHYRQNWSNAWLYSLIRVDGTPVKTIDAYGSLNTDVSLTGLNGKRVEFLTQSKRTGTVPEMWYAAVSDVRVGMGAWTCALSDDLGPALSVSQPDASGLHFAFEQNRASGGQIVASRSFAKPVGKVRFHYDQNWDNAVFKFSVLADGKLVKTIDKYGHYVGDVTINGLNATRIQLVVASLRTQALAGAVGWRCDISSFAASPAPTLNRLSPTSGKRGVTVTLTGANLGAVRGSSCVKFGGVKCAKYVSWSATRIKCRVPATAKFGRVKVTVVTAGGASGAKTFTVKR
jgi:hypothetical protein